MASTTPRVGLYMPADDGSEPMNVATDINDNLEKIDNSLGFVQSTSVVDPTTVYDGIASYETDTGRAKFRKGGVWNYLVNAGSTFLNNLLLGTANRIGIGTTTPVAIMDVVVASVFGIPIVRVKQGVESNYRMQLEADGIRFGSGTAGTDTRIYRPSASQISVTGNAVLENQLSVTGNSSFTNVQVTGNLDVDGTFTGDLNLAGNLSIGGIGKRMIARRTSDLSRANTVTPTADPNLFVSVVAGAVYDVELVGHTDGHSAGDLRINWSAPSGSVGTKMISGPIIGMTSRDSSAVRVGSYSFTTDIGYGIDSSIGPVSFHERGVVTIGGSSGTLNINWSQLTTNGTATTLKADTILIVTRIA